MAGQRGMEFRKVVFYFHNAACEGKEIIGQGTNLCIEAFIAFVVKCVHMRIEVTQIFLVLYNRRGESIIRLLLHFREIVLQSGYWILLGLRSDHLSEVRALAFCSMRVCSLLFMSCFDGEALGKGSRTRLHLIRSWWLVWHGPCHHVERTF